MKLEGAGIPTVLVATGELRLLADQTAAAVEPGDTAAAGANRINIDHWHPHRITVDDPFAAQQRLRSADQGDVATGAADIDRDQIVDAIGDAGHLAADHARRRTGKKRHNRASTDFR